MQNFLKKNKENYEKNALEELKIKEYILRYIKELQRHFDVPDKKIKIIIGSIYKDLSWFNLLKIMVKNKFEVLKSFIAKNYKSQEKYDKFKD